MTTARERAKAFVQSYGCGLGSDQPCSGEDCSCVEKAAQALRQAENDKLEEAARLMDRVMADSKAALIRTLKHED